MTNDNAALYVRASGGDNLLAAWVAVIDAHGAMANVEMDPHSWWDAYQSLYNLDYVSEHEMRSIDPQKVFFSHKYPRRRDVDGALYRLRSLREEIADEAERYRQLMSNDLIFKPYATPASTEVTTPEPKLDFGPLLPQAPTSFESQPNFLAPGTTFAPPGVPMQFPPGTTFELQVTAPSPLMPHQPELHPPTPTYNVHVTPRDGAPFNLEMRLMIRCCDLPIDIERVDMHEWIEAADSSVDSDVVIVRVEGLCKRNLGGCGGRFTALIERPIASGIVPGDIYREVRGEPDPQSWPHR